MYSHNLALERIQRMAIDAVAVFVAALAAVWIRHETGWFGNTPGTPWASYLFPAVIVAALTVLVLKTAGSYSESHRIAPTGTLLGALGMATMLALAAGFFYRSFSYSRATVVIFFPLAALAVVALRWLYDRYSGALHRSRDAARRVLIIGRSPTGRSLASSLRRRPAYYQLIGFLVAEPSDAQIQEEAEPPVLGDVASLARVIEEYDIDEVLIALPASQRTEVTNLIGECMRQQTAWKTVPDTYGLRVDRLRLDEFDGVPLVGGRDTRLVGNNWILKRTLDVAFACTVIVLLSPLYLAIAAAIKLTSRGPVLYKHTRVGLNGQPFTMAKFRSMRTGSSTAVHDAYSRQWIFGHTGKPEHSNGGIQLTPKPGTDVHKLQKDDRITPIGRVLRTTSLDELPQFWNVLRGEMSVVGPRPALPYEVERYTEWHKRRLLVPPGITGQWQVSGRNALSFKEMVALDVHYAENWSLETDLRIIALTIPALLKSRGR